MLKCGRRGKQSPVGRRPGAAEFGGLRKGGCPIPSTAFSGAARLQSHREALGSPWSLGETGQTSGPGPARLPVLGRRRRDRAPHPGAPTRAPSPTAAETPSAAAANRPGFPAGRAGLEQGGGEKRGRAWAAGGRGLQPPRASAAAAHTALPAPRSDSGAHGAGTRARARGRRCSSAPGPRRPERAALRPSRAAGRSGGWGFPADARRSVWPEDWRGRKGKAGTHTHTHTLAAARAHCTLAAARPRRGASRASLAPRLRPGTCRLRAPRRAPPPPRRPSGPSRRSPAQICRRRGGEATPSR